MKLRTKNALSQVPSAILFLFLGFALVSAAATLYLKLVPHPVVKKERVVRLVFCPGYEAEYFGPTIHPLVRELDFRSVVDRFNKTLAFLDDTGTVRVVGEGPADDEYRIGLGSVPVKSCDEEALLTPLPPDCLDGTTSCSKGAIF
ncbi:MAG: hypothetical protein KBD16_00265 [Candidatus Pacebacteria bacterium]|nr:hypothetical protein [Candidatus Paceibacterota bacterium]